MSLARWLGVRLEAGRSRAEYAWAAKHVYDATPAAEVITGRPFRAL